MYRAALLRLPGVVKASANAHSHTQQRAYAILVYSPSVQMMQQARNFVNKIHLSGGDRPGGECEKPTAKPSV